MAAASALAALGASTPARAAEVDAFLAGTAKSCIACDLAGRDLKERDFKRAKLDRAILANADLTEASLFRGSLQRADLSGAKLDLAWVMRANFTHANLSNATLLGLVVSTGLDYSAAEAPIFRGADFSGAHIIARLSRFDLRDANFHGAKMAPDMRNQSMGLMRSDLSGADLAGADFSDADLSFALMRFANLTGAKLRGANLSEADLSGADLTGADLTGANATGADFGEAVVKNARGLDTVKGWHPSVTR